MVVSVLTITNEWAKVTIIYHDYSVGMQDL